MCAREAEFVQITPDMIEAGLDCLTERWREWPYGERRVSLMLEDVFRAMRLAEVGKELVSDAIA
jgi:hypothetical protein